MTAPPRDIPFSVPPEQRPGEDLLVPYSVAEGMLLVGWTLLGPLVIGVLVGVGLQLGGVDVRALSPIAELVVTTLLMSLVVAGVFAWLAGRGRLTWRLLGSRRARSPDLLLGLAGGVLAFVASFTIITIGDALVGPLEGSGQSLLEPEMLTGTALLLNVLVAGLMAPVMEEVVFRGVLFQALGRRAGWVAGVLVSSAIFTVVHVEVIGLDVDGVVYGLALFGVGTVFAVLFHRSRTLIVPVVAHVTFNTAQLAIAAAGSGAG